MAHFLDASNASNASTALTIGEFTRYIFDIVDLYKDADSFTEIITVNNVTDSILSLQYHIVYLTDFLNHGSRYLYTFRLCDPIITSCIYMFKKNLNPIKIHDVLIRQLLSHSTNIVGYDLGISETYRKYKAHQTCLAIKEELLNR